MSNFTEPLYTTHAIVRNGLVPVFCDVNDKDIQLM